MYEAMGLKRISLTTTPIMNNSTHKTTLRSVAELKNGILRNRGKVAEKNRERWVLEAQERTKGQKDNNGTRVRRERRDPGVGNHFG